MVLDKIQKCINKTQYIKERTAGEKIHNRFKLILSSINILLKLSSIIKIHVRFTTMTDIKILLTGGSGYMYEQSTPNNYVELLLTLRT
jgi:hypothetical protein